MAGAAVGGDAVLIFARQPAAGERREGDQADALLAGDVGQSVLDPSVEHVVARLMDEHRRAELPERIDGNARLLGAVIGDADVERLAAAHDLVKRAHRLLDGGIRIGAVVVEDVDIVEVHAPEALVEAGDQVFPAAPVAVGARPHVIARLGGDDQLVAVRFPVAQHVDAEIPLGLAIGRAVVVGEIEMRDAVVKRRAQDVALHAEGRDIAEVMPQTQRDRGQHKAAPSAAAVGHDVIARGRGNVGHDAPPLPGLFLYHIPVWENCPSGICMDSRSSGCLSGPVSCGIVLRRIRKEISPGGEIPAY